MSFLKRLFGGTPRAEQTEAAGETIEHEGFRITAKPMEEGGQYRLSAIVEKEIGGETRTHRLIRADLFPSRGQAESASIEKARRLIEEQGERLFD